MDAKTTGIVAYITWIGLVIAFVLGDREGAKFHLNQALVIWLAGRPSLWPPVTPLRACTSPAFFSRLSTRGITFSGTSIAAAILPAYT